MDWFYGVLVCVGVDVGVRLVLFSSVFSVIVVVVCCWCRLSWLRLVLSVLVWIVR